MGDLTTFDYPGRTTTRGCQHMAVWLPLFSELCRLEGLVRSHLDVTQVAGDYEKSGGTHEEGTAADVAQYAERVSELAREAGAPASWPRGESFGQPSMRYHSHLALDCPCPSGADYQITAVKAGYNGLDSGGRGGRDYIRRPSTWRNYTSGVAWMRARIAQLQQEEDDMAMTPTERAALIADIAEAARAKVFEQRMAGPGIDAASPPTLHDYLVQALPARTAAAVHGQWLGSSGPTIGIAVQSTYGIVQALADRAGVDIDETAMAQQVAAIVAPVVRDAVVAAAQAGGTPEAVADAVVAKLGAALQD